MVFYARVEHLVLFVYVLLFSTGFAGIAALVFLRFRVSNGLVDRFLALQTTLLLGLGLSTVYFYATQVVRGGATDRMFFTVLRVVLFAVNVALYLIALEAIVAVRRRLAADERGARGMTRAVVVLSITVIGYAVARAVWDISGHGSGPGGALVASAVGYTLTGAALFCFGMALILARLAEEPAPVRRLARWWGWALIGFVPLTVLEFTLSAAGLSIAADQPLSLDFIFYFACNLAALAALARALQANDRVVGAAETTAGTAGVSPEFSIAPDAIERFGLSPRECELVPLVARGLSNKAIADALFIAPTTVRSHLYNLFQKVGARSRIELLNRLRA